MKKIVWGVILVMLITIVVGCSNKKSIVGKWQAEGDIEYYYIFNEDKTCAYEMPGAKMNCTYEDDGKKLDILYKGNAKANTYEYTIVGDMLIIKDSLGNDIKYTRKK